MADAITEATAKLQLDEETGEMVSKGELKKRLAKRAKKAKAEANRAAAPPKDTTKENTAAKKPKPEEAQLDPDAMFKEGFLAKVYDERPTGKDTVTRFPPEPNGLYVTVLFPDVFEILSNCLVKFALRYLLLITQRYSVTFAKRN
jgi:glutaminyl-tRNA synthetase